MFLENHSWFKIVNDLISIRTLHQYIYVPEHQLTIVPNSWRIYTTKFLTVICATSGVIIFSPKFRKSIRVPFFFYQHVSFWYFRLDQEEGLNSLSDENNNPSPKNHEYVILLELDLHSITEFIYIVFLCPMI